MKLSLPAQLLVGLCLLHLLVNGFWLYLNAAPIPWDQAGHTRLAIQYSRYFSGSLKPEINPLAISSYYPPLTHMVVGVVLTLMGIQVDTAAFVISLYLVAMLIGIYVLTQELSKNPWISFFTAGFFSLYLPVYESSRWFLLEIPLMTMLVYAWYFLHRSKYLTNWLYSFAFGLMVIGVFLTKWIGIAFLVVPTLAVLIQIVRKKPTTQQLSHLYLVVILILIGIYPWYSTNVHRLIEIGRLAAQGEITDPQQVLSLENLRFYLTHILNFQLTLWPALVSLGTAALYFFKKTAPYKLLLGSFFGFGYAFFTFISNKDIRYTIPLLIVLAFTSAYMLVTSFQNKQWVITSLIGGSLIWLVAQYFILSFHLLPTYQQAWNLGPLGWIDYINTGDIVVTPPRPDTTPNTKLIKYLASRQATQPASIMVGVDQATTNPSTLDLEILLQKVTTLSLEAPYDKRRFESEAEVMTYLDRFQYYLIPTNEVGPDASRHKMALQQMQQLIIHDRPELFEELQSYKSGNAAGDLRLLRKRQ
jgi:hypothetical protein